MLSGEINMHVYKVPFTNVLMITLCVDTIIIYIHYTSTYAEPVTGCKQMIRLKIDLNFWSHIGDHRLVDDVWIQMQIIENLSCNFFLLPEILKSSDWSYGMVGIRNFLFGILYFSKTCFNFFKQVLEWSLHQGAQNAWTCPAYTYVWNNETNQT